MSTKVDSTTCQRPLPANLARLAQQFQALLLLLAADADPLRDPAADVARLRCTRSSWRRTRASPPRGKCQYRRQGPWIRLRNPETDAKTLELVPNGDDAEPLDLPTATGLSGGGSEERWWRQIFERAGTLYALQLHRATEVEDSDAAASHLTLHAFEPASASGAESAALELPVLLPGECYLGTVQTENALLVARGRLDVGILPAPCR